MGGKVAVADATGTAVRRESPIIGEVPGVRRAAGLGRTTGLLRREQDFRGRSVYDGREDIAEVKPLRGCIVSRMFRSV